MSVEQFIDNQKKLLELEQNEESSPQLKISYSSIKDLENKNRCLRKVNIVNIFTGLFGKTIVELKLKNPNLELNTKVFSQGDIVGIYSDSENHATCQATAVGVFYKYDNSSLQISINDDEGREALLTNYNSTFNLIKRSSDITYSRLKQGLTHLEKRSNLLCGNYLIDLLFGQGNLSESTKLQDIHFINGNLNESQQEAVRFAVNRPDLAIIHGPPGTGKTTVAVEIINQLILSNKSNTPAKILVCTPSNIALDNLAEKLVNCNKIKRGRILRLGHSARVLEHLSDLSLDSRLASSDQAQLIQEVRSQMDTLFGKKKTSNKKDDKSKFASSKWAEIKELRQELRKRELKAIREVLSRSCIILSTLTGLRSNKSLPLNEVEFDVVLIDEASQAIEAASWLAIPRGKKLILAGDHKQLPPTVLSEKANQEGLGRSLMQRLLEEMEYEKISRMLTIQYRMNESIMRWSSDTFYDSNLTADTSVANHTLNDLQTSIDQSSDVCNIPPLVFIDTSGCELMELRSNSDNDEESKGNEGEAQLAVAYLSEIINRMGNLLTPDQIGIITPYSRQVQLIKHAISNQLDTLLTVKTSFNANKIEVSTVDGFQGREKEMIIVTLVRSNSDGVVGFLAEHRRLNVALTRAKRHLCVIGDASTINRSSDHILKELVNYWNTTADVITAHSYIYDYKITPGDCVTATNKTANQTSKSKSNDDKKVRKLEKRVRTFHANDAPGPLVFDSDLTSYHRAKLHELCEYLGLKHWSSGEGNARQLYISKNLDGDHQELIITKGVSDVVIDTKQSDVAINATDFNCEDRQSDIIKDVSEIDDDKTQPDMYISGSHIDGNSKHSFICDNISTADILTNSEEINEPDNENKSILETSDFPDLDNYKKSFVKFNNDDNLTIPQMSDESQMLMDKSDKLEKLLAAKLNNASQGDTKFKATKFKNNNITKNKTKNTLENKSEIPDDFDEMLEHFQEMDGTCRFRDGCKTKVAVLGLHCRGCRERFCVSHFQPEVHYCREIRQRKNKLNNGATSSQSQQRRHNQLKVMMNKKLGTLEAERCNKKKK